MTRVILSGIVLVLLVCGPAFAQESAEELGKLKARIEKLEADNVAMKKRAAELQARLATLEEKLNKNPALATPEKVKLLVTQFFDDLARGRNAGAYATMSAAYRKKTERAAFEAFLDKNPVLMNSLNVGGDYKFREQAKEKSFECDYLCQRALDDRPFVNIVLRVIEEEGAWKIDDFVEIKDFRKKK